MVESKLVSIVQINQLRVQIGSTPHKTEIKHKKHISAGLASFHVTSP